MNTGALTNWLEIATPMGSDNYYALSKLAPEKKQAIKIILAFFNCIMSIPFTLSEDEIVRTKLRWWKEELIKTQQRHGSHPLSIALAPIMEKYRLNYNALLQCISAIEDRVQESQFPDEQSLRDFYTFTYGVRERMIAKITFPEERQYAEGIYHIAYSLGLIDNLKHLRQRAAKTYVFFTDEEARELEVDKNLILTMKISEPLKKLFGHHIEKAQQHFKIGADLLNYKRLGTSLRWDDTTKNLQFLSLRAHLGLQWCELIKKEQFPLFTHHIELTPLRRWWYCRR